MSKEFTIKLSERDRKRLVKYLKRKLNVLKDYDLIMAEMDVEFYEDKSYKEHSLIFYKRQLATVKKDIKMLEKLKNQLKK